MHIRSFILNTRSHGSSTFSLLISYYWGTNLIVELFVAALEVQLYSLHLANLLIFIHCRHLCVWANSEKGCWKNKDVHI